MVWPDDWLRVGAAEAQLDVSTSSGWVSGSVKVSMAPTKYCVDIRAASVSVTECFGYTGEGTKYLCCGMKSTYPAITFLVIVALIALVAALGFVFLAVGQSSVVGECS